MSVSVGGGASSPMRPLTPKELAPLIGREAAWIRLQIRAGNIPTCPPHRRPYQIPRYVLRKFGLE